MSRRMHSRTMLGLVDWQLLVLFCGLFVVNHALQQTRVPDLAVAELLRLGVDPAHPGWLFAITVMLSNAVSNVPATILLLPVAHHPLAGPILALGSTLPATYSSSAALPTSSWSSQPRPTGFASAGATTHRPALP